ncbi:RmlC-like cupin, partial [Coccomyxa subellipsoidea C-169]
QDLAAYRLPNQTNRLALVFDPMADGVPFTFGLEIFEPGHKTAPHTHPSSQELFFILAGDGEGFCDGQRFPVAAGDAVAFPPRSLHGIDVSPSGRMYCLELMQPNDMFAEFVKAGQPLGGLADDDLCVLAALGCGGVLPGESSA